MNEFTDNFYLLSSMLGLLFMFYLMYISYSSFQDQYHALHPRGVNPVQLNDVFFTIHAVVITAITIIQCFIYEVILLA